MYETCMLNLRKGSNNTVNESFVYFVEKFLKYVVVLIFVVVVVVVVALFAEIVVFSMFISFSRLLRSQIRVIARRPYPNGFPST